MKSTQSFESIDYSELRASIEEDLADGTLTPDSTINLVRINENVKIGSEIFQPIMDWFYETPALENTLSEMTVLDTKKMIFELIDKTEDEGFKETLKILADDLGAYTKGRAKRNDNKCKVLFTAEPRLPMMVFFDEENAKDELDKRKVSEVLDEIGKCDI